MPKIRYQLKLGNDEFWEEQLFPPGDPKAPIGDAARALVTREVLERLNGDRKKLNEPELELLTVSVINPFIHEHTWRAGKLNQFAGKKPYKCERCRITGYRKFHIVKGEIGGITRDDEYKQQKHELCHDPLKKLKKLSID